MQKGIIICTSTNTYLVEEKEKIYKCLARGKFKKEKINLLVGDKVEFTITNSEKQEGVIEQILPRKNELKRPKMSNLTQIILVVSMKMPNPDLLLLDKQLIFAEFMGLKATIVLNKVDLEDKKEIDKIFEALYTSDKSRKVAGLGLSICKSAIEGHGGKIWAENNNIGGLTIKFTLMKI